MNNQGKHVARKNEAPSPERRPARSAGPTAQAGSSKAPTERIPGRKKGKKRHTVGRVVLGLVIAALLFGGIYVYRLLTSPEALFKAAAMMESPAPIAGTVPTAAPQTGEPASAAETPAPGQAASPAETAAPTPQADPLSQQKIVNIMLMGIDAFEDGTTTSGTMPHTDVNIVVSINFETEEVTLLSLARDTFTITPGYYGYYKLNGVFNVGGGMEDPQRGFDQVRRTAEQWLGGISIPYYYGVDFQAVIDIVDAIGGIDYYVDQAFFVIGSTKGEFEGSVGVGYRHLNGREALSYMRARTALGADMTDRSRTERQRKMLIAIFQKLKNEGKLSQVPALISAVNSGIYTNTTLAQTVALANYARKISPESIHSMSLFGTMPVQFDWGFEFIDQQKRIETIRSLYGIEAQPVGFCTPAYESWLHIYGFQAVKRIRNANKVLAYAGEQAGVGAAGTQELEQLIAECQTACDVLTEAYQNSDRIVLDACAAASLTGENTVPLRSRYGSELEPLMEASQSATEKLAKACAYPDGLTWWTAEIVWVHDPDINEVDVDFR